VIESRTSKFTLPFPARLKCCAGLAAATLVVTGAPALAVDSGLSLSIGFTSLQTQLGSSIPTGNNVIVGEVEVDESNAGPSYSPNRSDSEFGNKAFTLRSGNTSTSSHATTVGRLFYGSSSSLTPGVVNVQLWNADDWVVNSLEVGTSFAPDVQTAEVTNHSYQGTLGNTTLDAEANRRLDYMVNRDKQIVMTAMNNGNSTVLPPIWAQSYNTISVGLSNGASSHGNTTAFDGAGRMKPDLVVPATFGLTSFALPTASSAATLLLSKAKATPALTNARNPEVIKSLMMAGATKTEFPTWTHTQTRPLDFYYGAGELNIYRSYNILIAGEQDASSISTVNYTGWDYNTTTTGGRDYIFNLSETATEVSVVLTWNRTVTDGPTAGFDAAASLADLRLTLSNSSGLVIGSTIVVSDSAVDNVELIYLTNLLAGQYAIEVTSATNDVSYSVAWFSAVPEPGTPMVILVFSLGAMTRRRRASR